MKTIFKALKLAPLVALCAITACTTSNSRSEMPARHLAKEASAASENTRCSGKFSPKLFPMKIESEQELETIAKNTFSFTLKILQRVQTPQYELFVAEGHIGSYTTQEYIAVYLKQGDDSFKLLYESPMPERGRQNASFFEAQNTFIVPMENYIGFKRAEIESNVLNIYFDHLTIEAPFGTSSDYFRYIEEKIWKSVPLPKN